MDKRICVGACEAPDSTVSLSGGPVRRRPWSALFRMAAGVAVLSLLSVQAAAQEDDVSGADEDIPPAEAIDERVLNYALGYDLGRTLKGFAVDSIEFNAEQIASGLSAALKEWESAYPEEEMIETIKIWAERQGKLREVDSTKALENEATTNLEEARQVAEANRQNRKIKETDSGLQYEVLRKGKGPQPKADDWVKVHYVGSVVDGRVFDSSRERGEPIVFRLTEVIQGWGEGLQLMESNALFRFHIPPHLAYGKSGVPTAGLIGPNKLLVFEVELLDFSSSKESLAGGN